MSKTISYASTKTYTHAEGLSCCFRQWKAESHCRLLHGYAIQVELEFRATKLDPNNWVVDFGGLKEVKQWLKDNYDHKMLVAADDPSIDFFINMGEACAGHVSLADVRIVKNVGCEGFAEEIFDYVFTWANAKYGGRVTLHKVEVREHAGNSAICRNKVIFQ